MQSPTNRREFLQRAAAATVFAGLSGRASFASVPPKELSADIVIVGGGVGGCAAALAALRNGCSVILTEETDWIGGQFTSQGVSAPDEHGSIESFGRTAAYASFRESIRAFYRDNFPLTAEARRQQCLNPGGGWVSVLCHEPNVALAVFNSLLLPYSSTSQLTLLLETSPIAADMKKDRVNSVMVRSLDGHQTALHGRYFLDATELGSLLPLTKTAYVTGTEAQSETHELHAPTIADPNAVQAIASCFALDYRPGEDHTIDKPDQYAFWRDYVPQLTPAWPGKLLSLDASSPYKNEVRPFILEPTLDVAFPARFIQAKDGRKVEDLWTYRRIRNRHNFAGGSNSITLVNWPQNDYWLGRIDEVPADEAAKHIKASKQLGLSLLYWIQTEAPHEDGKTGWPGVRFRPDVMGTVDGFAKTPYVRESRRIRALFTITEEHVGFQQRQQMAGPHAENLQAANFPDSVGIGSYRLDTHPTVTGINYVDLSSLPHEIPLGALIPEKTINLIAAAKNIGTTHLSNACYREHPIEWNIGESAGCLAAFCLRSSSIPRQVREDKKLLADFQQSLASQGIELHWPSIKEV